MGESLKDSEQLTFVENLCISGAAAIIAKTVAAPIERIKLNIQNQNEMLKQGRIDSKYKGIGDCAKRILNQEGMTAFWRGNTANVLRYFPTQALNFAFLGKIKENFHPNKTDSYPMQLGKNVLSGGVAGSLSLVFVYSLDYARTRLANDAKSSGKSDKPRQYKGMLDVYTKTFASDGIRGLYRGFMISCVGIFVYRGLYFGLYDTAKPIISGKKINFILAVTVAYIVTVFSGLVSYPIDTVRRRMMMTSGESVKYKNSLDCFIQICKNDGFQSLFKGAGANILRGIAGALVISGFDEVRQFYINHFKDAREHS